uniref:ATP-dependent DNA helicase n=1 Tax=Tanacetum cinerariifolium TaxID=118510 RepID=A0A699GZF0_TANCI|nr:ATP-dependent DNA helicase PIF1-like [Tanacetum cinerariifolium]
MIIGLSSPSVIHTSDYEVGHLKFKNRRLMKNGSFVYKNVVENISLNNERTLSNEKSVFDDQSPVSFRRRTKKSMSSLSKCKKFTVIDMSTCEEFENNNTIKDCDTNEQADVAEGDLEDFINDDDADDEDDDTDDEYTDDDFLLSKHYLAHNMKIVKIEGLTVTSVFVIIIDNVVQLYLNLNTRKWITCHFEDMMIGVTQSSTSILTPIHVDLNKGTNVSVDSAILKKQEYQKNYYKKRKQKKIAEANANIEAHTPIVATQNLLALTCEPTHLNLNPNKIPKRTPLQAPRSHGTTSVGPNANMEPETLVGSTQNLSALTCETTLDHPHGNNVLLPLFDQEYNQITDGNNVGVAPTIQSRKEYHKSYYQHRKQKNIATDVSEEDNISHDDPYDFVYNGLPQEHFLLKQQPPCVICGAKKIQYEFPTFCCMNGNTNLQPLDIPSELYNLFMSQCQLGKMFRKNIHSYNTNFSFASMGVNLDKKYGVSGSGVYTFHVQRGIYHKVNQLVPRDGEPSEAGWHKRIPRAGVDIRELINDDNDDGVKDEEDLYQGIIDCVNAREVQSNRIGQVIVLRVSFIEGPRDMQKHILEAETLVQDAGKPDTFLTMTCNPNWPEIVENLYEGQTAQDRPDLVTRVFLAKLEYLKYQLFTKHILGIVPSHIYVIEFHKWGLPHAYFLLIMTSAHKLANPNHYDKVVCAEIPDLNKHKDLHQLNYPRQFQETTRQGDDSYPLYRRRDNGFEVDVRNNVLDNRWVVPYNPTLVMMFNCHINGEQWKMRGSMVFANLANEERFYLHVLLQHVKGPTGFDYLYTVNEILHTTFCRAALERGSIKSDNHIHACLREASTHELPYALRRLFATLLIFCEPGDVRKLWDDHYESLSEDCSLNCASVERVKNMVLTNISAILQSIGRSLSDFDLPNITVDVGPHAFGCREVHEECFIVSLEKDILAWHSLNIDQKNAHDTIMRHVDAARYTCFLFDGPRGTGKTFLYKALLANVHSHGIIALATASSRAAAYNMTRERTAHSRLKIPINLTTNSTCNIKKQSGLVKLICQAKLIIWDEASTAKRQAIEAVDRTMQDITWVKLPFGGKIMVFKGDFRQVIGEYYVRISDDMTIPYTNDADSKNALINEIFPSFATDVRLSSDIVSRAILSTKNEHVYSIKNELIDRFPGEEKVYYSFDKTEDDMHNFYPLEFLNSLNMTGLPPNCLRLKIGCPIILLRNLDLANGLCNGMRLICKRFDPNVINAEIAAGQHAGVRGLLPRISLAPFEEYMFSFKLKRTQFPIRLSFAMTINKAQGQTILNVGVYLPESVFSHG